MIWQKQPQSTTAQSAIETPKGELKPRYDVIVVGGGTNGLTCAAYAARAGKSVLLLEATESLGGACQTLALASGQKISRAAHLIRHFDARTIGKLGLARKGFRFETQSLPTIALGRDGSRIRFDKSLTATGGSLVDINERDAERFVVLYRKIEKIAKAIGRDSKRRARDYTGKTEGAPLWPQCPKGLSRSLQALYQELAISSIGHFLEREFETPLLRGAIAFDAVLGRNLSPYWPGTAVNWPIALSGRMKGVQGAIGLPFEGMGSLPLALARALMRHGGTFRTERKVTRLIAEAGRIKAVQLASGATIEAGQVVCAFGGADALLQELLVARHQTPGLFMPPVLPKGTTAKLNLELEGLPRGVNERARYLISPSLEAIEQAFVPSKYGQFSPEPVMEIIFPGFKKIAAKEEEDGESNRQAASIIVQFAPFDLEGGWDQQRDRFVARCASVLDQYLPGFASRIVGGELLTPPDLEEKLGIMGGHWHFHRPIIQSQAEFDRDHERGIRSREVEGLYLCGGDRHPGAGVRGTSGRLAAEALLKDAGRIGAK